MKTTKVHQLAQDIMTKEPVCAEPTMNIRQLAQLLEENEISGCPVVDSQGRVIGVVSKTDLLRRCAEGTRDHRPGALFAEIGEEEDERTEDPMACVDDFMTEDAATVSPTTPLSSVARLMVERRIHRIVVVDHENFPVGIITSLDLLAEFPSPTESA
jgi:CBS domain-containing protein